MPNSNSRKSSSVKHPRESWVEMTEIVLPQYTNALGTVFGGTVMAWVDIAAATCALRHCQIQVVTASIDAIHFLAPIKLGCIVTIKASVNHTFRSSCEVGVKVTAENPLTCEKHHTASAYVTMVAIGKDGKAVAIPQIEPETAEEKRRSDAALERRDLRLQLREKQRKKQKSS